MIGEEKKESTGYEEWNWKRMGRGKVVEKKGGMNWGGKEWERGRVWEKKGVRSGDG